MVVIKTKFKSLSTINRINVFCYPTVTNVEYDSEILAISAMLIEYATDSALTNWVTWDGLVDRSEEIGQTPTTINEGLVTDNVNTYNAFHDAVGVSAYGVRVLFYNHDTIYVTEIEVWQSLVIDKFNQINTKTDKDLTRNIFKAGVAMGTYVAEPLNYFPGQPGDFFNLTADDTNKMRARVYGGFTHKGLDYWTIMGHFTTFDWTVYQKSKKIEFRIKDRVKDLRDSTVFLANEILENKTREWLLEWQGLKANLHSDEMELFQSKDIVNFFYPVNAKTWTEMNEVGAGLNDVDLSVDRFNILRYKVFLQTIPYFWKVLSYDDFNLCTLDNLQLVIEGGRAVVKPAGHGGEVELLNDTTEYSSSVETGVKADKWYLAKSDIVTVTAGNNTLKLSYNIKGAPKIESWFEDFNGVIKIIVKQGATVIDSWENEGSPDTYIQNYKDVTVPGSGNYTIERYLLTNYQAQWGYIPQEQWLKSFTNELICEEYASAISEGTITSYDKLLNIDPTSWGAFELDSFGSGIKAYTDTSPDGITWEGWQQVVSGEIKSTLNKYIRWKVVFEARDSWDEVPKLYEVLTAYNGGQGQAKYSGVDIDISDNDVDEIPISFTDEANGERTQYDKVEVVINPYYLQAPANIWDGEVDWTTLAGETHNFTPAFDNPIKIDVNYRLVINGLEFQDGETTQGGLIVTFTKHPVTPIIDIKQETVPVVISEFYIEGQEYKQTSKETYSAGTGNKVLRIENKYINSGTFAQAIAEKKLYELKKVRESIANDMGIYWHPIIKFRGLVRISNEELGTTKLYEIYSIKQIFNTLPKDMRIETQIRVSEITVDSMSDPGIFGQYCDGNVVYLGENPGGKYYFLGSNING